MHRAKTTVVVVLPPQPVFAAAGAQRCGRLARHLLPTRLARPLAHRQGGEQGAGCAPHHVVGRIRDVGAYERLQIVRKRRIGGEPKGDKQGPRLAAEQRRRVRVAFTCHGVRLGALKFERT